MKLWVSNHSNPKLETITSMKKLIYSLCLLGFLLPATVGCSEKVTQPEDIKEKAPAETPEEGESMSMEAPE